MAQVINTNSLSLLTQNNLNKSQASLNSAIERLSSGVRINSAKDDAAGQAIANRFTANIKGLTQASRNANDGISMAQTTEGALSEINTNLQRIRELTVQANNATNSDVDKTSIQAEIVQRMEEIKRTSEQTDFNGTKVLNADQTLKIQVGAKDGETISIDLKKMDLAALGLTSFNVDKTGTANPAATKDDLTLASSWTQGTAGEVGYKSAGSWVQGATDATTGAITYTQTTSTVTTAAADAYDVSFTAATRSNVFAAATTTGDTVALNGGPSALTNYVYNSGADRFSSGTTAATVGSTTVGTAPGVSGAPVGGVASYLVPTGTSTVSATVNIGGTDQKIVVDSTGNVKDDAGNQLYLDITGNLTQNTANGGTPLVAANIGKGDAGDILKSMSEGTVGTIGNVGSTTLGATVTSTGGTITVTQASGSTVDLVVASFTDTSDGVAAAVKGTGQTWSVTENLTAADMQTKSAAGAAQVTVGGTAYDITAAGAVKSGGNAVYLTDALAPVAGALVTADKRTVAAVVEVVATTTEDYHLQTNGAVMDGSGNRVYKDSDETNVRGFTLTDRSGNTSTENPLDVLDKALSTVDQLRGALGAVQNRFDSVISNLGTTITNLSSSRSRIEDADYATEVSNMTRANILQQAGTSVLAQANQTTQNVLSLLR